MPWRPHQPSPNLPDLCLYMRDAYERSFTTDNILSSFSRTDTGPIFPRDMVTVPLPVSKDVPSTLVSVENLSKLLETESARLRKGMLLQVPVLVMQRHRGDSNPLGSINIYTKNPRKWPIRSTLHRESNQRRPVCHHANCHQSTPPIGRDSLTAHREPSTWLYKSLTGHWGIRIITLIPSPCRCILS